MAKRKSKGTGVLDEPAPAVLGDPGEWRDTFPNHPDAPPASGPIVCKAVGELPLADVPGLPLMVVEVLATEHEVHTLADLARHAKEASLSASTAGAEGIVRETLAGLKVVEACDVEVLDRAVAALVAHLTGGKPPGPAAQPSPEPTAPPPPAAPEFRVLPLDQVHPSATNPRKTFDQAALDQLAASVREKGVLEPVLVRPAGHYVVRDEGAVWYVCHPRASGYGENKCHTFTGQDRAEQCRKKVDELNEEAGYELVAGERRYRASKLAGLRTIPALVRELSDKAAAEIAVVENDQREDVPPLEQAEGYARLIQLGDDAETIAAKIGRPVPYVAGRLQLTHLSDELKDDLRSGKLPFGHAWLLSRLQPADQLELRGRLYEQWGPEQGRVCTLKALRDRIKETRLYSLSAAPWKWADEALVPEAGSCTACPKRSGNNRTLFDELLDGKEKKTEYCTDGGCYRRKREAFVELQLRTVKEKHGEVLKVSGGWSAKGEDVLSCDRYEVVDKKTAKALPADEVKRAVIVEPRYADEADQVGKVVTVRIKKAAAKTSADDGYARQQREARQKQEAGRAAQQKALAAAADCAWQAIDGHLDEERLVEVLRALAGGLALHLGYDVGRVVCKRRGLSDKDTRKAIAAAAAEMTTAGNLFALVAELVAARESQYWGSGYGALEPREKAFWKAFGIDKQKLIQAALAEKKAGKAAQKPAPKKKAKVARG